MTTKTFTVAGITEHNGITKVRFTDDMVRRVKQFSKGGASRVSFVSLPNSMTKLEALRYMLTCKEFANPDDQATIEYAIEDREHTSKSKGPVKANLSIDEIAKRPKKDITVSDILEAVS